jgi:putative tryptophan/tyrosine transport system substrate-binding protein
METRRSTSPMARRRFLRHLIAASFVNIGGLAACARPVPPAGLELQADGRVATATPPPARLLRIGILYPECAPDDPSNQFFDALRDGGFVVGSTLSNAFYIERRQMVYDPGRVVSIRDALIRQKADVIVAPTAAATALARSGTTTIPIVAISSDDLVASGTVASLERPGGNVTGVTTHDPLRAERALGLLARVVPRIAQVAVLWNPGEPDRDAHAAEILAAAQARGWGRDAVPVGGADEVHDVLRRLVQRRVDATISLGDPSVSAFLSLVGSLAAVYRLPVLFERPELVRGGGLLALGPDVGRLWRRAGEYVVQIARGARPGDLPVTHDPGVKVAANLSTARVLGLTLPPSVLAEAAEIIP